MRKNKQPVRHIKAVDDTVKLSDREGNGILKYSVSIDQKGKVVRYSFAYINDHLCTADNGRVLGYDNCHGYHHRHFMGQEEEIKFSSLEDIQNKFEAEWENLHEKVKKKKHR